MIWNIGTADSIGPPPAPVISLRSTYPRSFARHLRKKKIDASLPAWMLSMSLLSAKSIRLSWTPLHRSANAGSFLDHE